jgi:hypothetical protein
MAAEWRMTNARSLDIAQGFYVAGNNFPDEKLFAGVPALPKSCVESSRILLKKRELYE